ncbi:putative peroxiredoxin [Arcanobacterium pluranimalium]|uniref:hypothetical protein n=1 Tax=Arcanobacterium pluranimalium TaxID=108028 RepID=UPI001956FB96|nr:hypothetical protein [Arcanobacterium pluranimalium]MBM7825234.1 putative peroxiredoxin [Arcanobacterium pluranimalium]
MTLELPVSADCFIDESLSPVKGEIMVERHVATAWIGIDLSMLGAMPSEMLDEYGHDVAVDHVNFPRLASSVKAALEGGLDFVTLNRSFHTSSDQQHDRALDGVKAASKLLNIASGGISVEVPPLLKFVEAGTQALAGEYERCSSLELQVNATSDFSELSKMAQIARDAGVKVTVITADPAFALGHVKEIAAFADIVRVKTAEPLAAQKLRTQLRDYAAKKQREILVFVDVGIVISASRQAAQERAVLIADINHKPLFDGISSVTGTVYDVADAIESWVATGAADGIVFVPASLPTDLASVLRGVLPLMKERTKIDDELPKLSNFHTFDGQ